MNRDDTYIRASDISEFLYCERAFWLRRFGVSGEGNGTALSDGIRYHEAHGRAVRRGGALRRIARWLLISAVMLAIAGAVARVWG